MGPRAGLDECGKSRPHRSPDRPAPHIELNFILEDDCIANDAEPHGGQYYKLNLCHLLKLVPESLLVR